MRSSAGPRPICARSTPWVNEFTADAAASVERLHLDPAIEARARNRLTALRARRDAHRVAELRAHLDQAARGQENLLPLFISCVENLVTVGEICHTLRQAWGEYRPAGV
jgi:methylmalonyl-CoA mutase, N-terminal domain